ncbi:hypothetical protein CIK02_01045 [Pseudomonas putida]|nr:hypothetical protein CIK02_01045 [Pseudomonas putida]
MPCGSNCLAQFLKAGAIPVGAGLPANTGEARAIHRGVFFAGKPAPTGTAHHLSCAPAPTDVCPLPAPAFHPVVHGSLPGKSPACHHRA